MNKLIIKEAVKAGIQLENSNFIFNSQKINANVFIYEVVKLRFSIPLKQAINHCKNKLFCMSSNNDTSGDYQL